MPKVTVDDFEVHRLLGIGAYGKVFLVRRNSQPDDRSPVPFDQGMTYAVKMVSKNRTYKSGVYKKTVVTERSILAGADHPFVVKMLYAFETSKALFFFMEFCQGGDLYTLIHMNGALTESQALLYLCEVVCGLSYLQDELNIVYRDLKAENILIDAEGHIRIADFGLCHIFQGGETRTKTMCGTTESMAPEVLSRNPDGYGKSADVWSLGVLMHVMLTQYTPFYTTQEQYQWGMTPEKKILSGAMYIRKEVTHTAFRLITTLMTWDHTRRYPSVSHVKQDPYFYHICWTRVAHKGYFPWYVPGLYMRDNSDVSSFETTFTKKDIGTEMRVSSIDMQTVDEKEMDLGDFDYVAPELQYYEQCSRKVGKVQSTVEDIVIPAQNAEIEAPRALETGKPKKEPKKSMSNIVERLKANCPMSAKKCGKCTT